MRESTQANEQHHQQNREQSAPSDQQHHELLFRQDTLSKTAGPPDNLARRELSQSYNSYSQNQAPVAQQDILARTEPSVSLRRLFLSYF